MSDPLCRPEPTRDSCRYVKRFAVANDKAAYVGGFARYRVHLTDDQLWLSRQLSIPIRAIRAKQIIRRGWLIKRDALRIVFENPTTGKLDTVHLCDIDLLGFYHLRNLEKLSSAIDKALKDTEGVEAPAVVAKMPPVSKAAFSGILFGPLRTLFRSADVYTIEL